MLFHLADFLAAVPFSHSFLFGGVALNLTDHSLLVIILLNAVSGLCHR
nr:MAG TPA: hypothetical protein [Caudoviricetes sp.]